MTERTYRQYLDKGPDGMDYRAVREALQWRDDHPIEAHAVVQQRRAQWREEEDKEVLRAAWEADGGDRHSFDAAYPELRRKHTEAKLQEMEDQASTDAWRSVKNAF